MKKYIVILFTLLLGMAACRSGEQPVAEAPTPVSADNVFMADSQASLAGISIGKLESRVLNALLQVNGTVDVPPQNIISVSFPVAGYLKSTKLLPGMHVRRGEVIGYMEDMSLIQLQQDYLTASTRLEYLSQEWQRQQTLRNSQVNSLKTLQQVTAEYNTQKVLLKGMEEKLRLIGLDPASLSADHLVRSIPIHSPIDGFVSKVNVNTGKYVNPTDVLFELINPDDLHASLTVFEKDMPRVQIGQKVKVNFVDDPGHSYECEVILVTRNVDESRSGTVHCHFETRPSHLLPGMFLHAAIEVKSVQADAAPEESVVRYGDTEYIFIQTAPQQYHLQAVETGIHENGWVELLNLPGDLRQKNIVVRNAYALLGKLKNTME